MQHSFIFEDNKITTSNYYIKDQNLELEINIKVLSMQIEENIIKICYLVNDTDNEYEYKIEVSEKL